MAVITKIKRSKEAIEKGVDKIFKNKYKGADTSPFKLVDDLGSPPLFRNPKDAPGTERKKLKMIGEKLKKGKTKNLIDQSGKVRGGLRVGGAVCKLAKRGKGRAYGKNS
jgi:hypothetical protein